MGKLKSRRKTDRFQLDQQLLKISRICLGVFLTFLFFGILSPVEDLDLHDPRWIRWIHLSFILFILTGTYSSSWVKDRLPFFLNITFYTMSIHSFLVLYWNGLNISYLVGMVLVISCIGVSFVQKKWLVTYLVFIIIASIPVGLYAENPSVPLYLYFPTIITPALVSYLTLNIRLNSVEKLKESEAKLSEYHERMTVDLELAQETQKALVTLKFPTNERYNLAGYYKSYDLVGGDVLSVERRPDGKLNILFADVSGHGVASAMVSAMTILAFKIVSRSNILPAEALRIMNDTLRPLVVNHHVSACFATLDHENRILDYSYAGHPSILLIRDSEIKELEGRGSLILAPFTPKLADYRLKLHSDDRILFYSDGLFELFNSKREFYGEEKFFESVKRNLYLSGEIFLQTLVDESLDYAGGISEDDMTLLIVEMK